MLRIRQATIEDHKNIVQISKQSKYTRDFTNHIFSGEAMYEKGWIRVIEYKDEPHGPTTYDAIVGFTCVRHKVRAPETVLYFIGVDPEVRSEGLGSQLLNDLIEQTPHKTIALNVMKENTAALRFYLERGFVHAGDALKGKAHHLELHL